MGGTVGNGFDRLSFGTVTDFINFHFWPVFNVADSADQHRCRASVRRVRTTQAARTPPDRARPGAAARSLPRRARARPQPVGGRAPRSRATSSRSTAIPPIRRIEWRPATWSSSRSQRRMSWSLGRADPARGGLRGRGHRGHQQAGRDGRPPGAGPLHRDPGPRAPRPRRNMVWRSAGLARPGIVHRLDKGTSGLIVVARNDASHRALSAQLKDRSLSRTYLAIVRGRHQDRCGRARRADRPPPQRPARAWRWSEGGRFARTRYQVVERRRGHTLLRCDLETGRTHQIRVHLAAFGHPVAGDAEYGGRKPGSRTGRCSTPGGCASAIHEQGRDELRGCAAARLRRVLGVARMNRGLLVVISGPSGRGQGHDHRAASRARSEPDLLGLLARRGRRDPVRNRTGFITTSSARARFEALVAKGAFLEHAT